MRGVSFQPSPREPIYTASTYKPPSLYPNKKQRTDFVLEPVPPFTNPSGFTSSRLSSTSFEMNEDATIFNAKISFAVPSANATFGNAHQPLTRHQLSSDRVSRREEFGHSIAGSRRESVLEEPTGPRASQYRPPPAKLYRVTDLERSGSTTPDDWARTGRGRTHPARDTFVQPQNLSMARRECANESDKYHPGSSERGYDMRFSHHPEPRREALLHGDLVRREIHYAPDEPYTSQLPTHSHYQSTSPSFFMPNHYDYQQNKARKRSNLPKQSTEIMKTWFDQVTMEPYLMLEYPC